MPETMHAPEKLELENSPPQMTIEVVYVTEREASPDPTTAPVYVVLGNLPPSTMKLTRTK
jgi:hypothetical protein